MTMTPYENLEQPCMKLHACNTLRAFLLSGKCDLICFVWCV